MAVITNPQQQWENLATETFLEMLRARDGDLEIVAKLAQVLADLDSMKLMAAFLSKHPVGKQAFQEYTRLGEVNLEQLHKLPTNTLGYAYSNHMLERGLTPFSALPATNDYEYLGAHINETHDIWHVVTGFDTDITGEIKLEAFYVKQLQFSRFWLSLLTKNLLKTTIYQIENSEQYLDAITEGWLMARNAQPLFGIQWNQLWDHSLAEIRDKLNLTSVFNSAVGYADAGSTSPALS